MNKILIVDDNPSDLKVLDKLLIKKGFDVSQTSDAFSAIDILSKTKFDLVILDWMMPKISGMEILKTIRNHQELKSIPAIFVTSRNEAKDIKKAIEQGVTDYLIKPIDPMILESKIAKILKREDVWNMTPVLETEGNHSILRSHVQITGISEIAIQFKSATALRPLDHVMLESDFLKTIGINEVQIRIHECTSEQNDYRVLGILIGLSQSQLQAIRVHGSSKLNRQ